VILGEPMGLKFLFDFENGLPVVHEVSDKIKRA
jgi:hypothetical protein